MTEGARAATLRGQSGTHMRRHAIFAAALSLLALALATARAEAAFAIAFNPTTGKAAAYNGSFDLDVARRQALSNCGNGCRIVASGKGRCAAVVEAITGGGSVWALGYGTTTETAANQGWHECRRKGGVNCKRAAAICD
jgi:hypothetical protein